MNTQEKANELFNKYSKGIDEQDWQLCEFESCAKQCALISVDEIMQVLSILPYGMQYLSEIDYWEGVKHKLEKL